MEEKNQGKKIWDPNTIIIVITILIGALIIAGSIFLNNKKNPPASGQDQGGTGLEIGESAVIGNVDAPNTIVEFLDFQCPYCEKFSSETEPILRQKYVETGKAKIAYKLLTFIDSFDKYADPQESLLSAEAAECAKEQGKFAAMHDAIFKAEGIEAAAGKTTENSGNLTKDFLIQTAQSIGLDTQKLQDCMGSDRIKSTLETYANDANAAMQGRVSTPAVFVNGTKLSNPFDLSAYESIIK